MASYLSSILNGDVQLPSVKQWIAGSSSLPPAPSSETSPRSPSSAGVWPNFTVDQFRVVLLNHVKEEADKVFFAQEKQAAETHAKAQVVKDDSLRDTKSRPVASKLLAHPGVVNDSSFPALAFQFNKAS